MVYLDLAVMLNFLVDFLLLLGTNRLSGFSGETGRCVLAGALGGIYSGACLLPGFSFLGRLWWRVTCLGCMGSIAFGWNRSAFKRSGVFLLLSLALGGLALQIGGRNFWTLALAAMLCWGLCGVAFGEGVGTREFVPVTLRFQGKQTALIALRDSGNTLRDPVTGEPVLVVSAEVGQKLTGLTRQEVASPLETLGKGTLPGLRLIPYQTVGCGRGMLLGLPMERIGAKERAQRVLVAFAAEGLGNGEGYQGLMGGLG